MRSHRTLRIVLLALLLLALAPLAQSGASHAYTALTPTAALHSGPSGCLDVEPHHSNPIVVQDDVLGGDVSFRVWVDHAREGQEEQFPCGDNVFEPCGPGDVPGVTCNPDDQEQTFPSAGSGSSHNAGTPSFGPGADGMYHVVVLGGTAGDVS